MLIYIYIYIVDYGCIYFNQEMGLPKKPSGMCYCTILLSPEPLGCSAVGEWGSAPRSCKPGSSFDKHVTRTNMVGLRPKTLDVIDVLNFGSDH